MRGKNNERTNTKQQSSSEIYIYQPMADGMNYTVKGKQKGRKTCDLNGR